MRHAQRGIEGAMTLPKHIAEGAFATNQPPAPSASYPSTLIDVVLKFLYERRTHASFANGHGKTPDEGIRVLRNPL